MHTCTTGVHQICKAPGSWTPPHCSQGRKVVRERGGKKPSKPPKPCITEIPFLAGQCPSEVGTKDGRQLRDEGWQGGNGAGDHSSPPALPGCLHSPANPSFCLAFPFLAKITPEHVSTLSCKESYFGEAFSLSLFSPLDTNQTQLHFIGCEGRATPIGPSPAPSPK